jgi:hypothetical protein
MKRSPIFWLALYSAAVTAPGQAQAATDAPFDHVVIVIMSSRYSTDIYASLNAPYLNSLLAQGASFSDFHGFYPDQAAYLALFSGDVQGVTTFDTCPLTNFGAGNLAQQLIDASQTFAQYSEGLGLVGSTACTNLNYTQFHNPVPVFFPDSSAVSRDFTEFATAVSASTLPTVSFVVPNLLDDMKGGTVADGDLWLSTNIPPFLASASAPTSLLIITWDKDGNVLPSNNPIPMIFYGPHVKQGYISTGTINHYNILRTIEDWYGLPHLGGAATSPQIMDVWDYMIFQDGFE